MFRKKLVRCALALLLLSVLVLLPAGSVDALDSIKSIDVSVTLQDNGDAVVEQTWKTDVSTGTEFFIPLQYLNHMSVENFTVTDDTGMVYETLPYWDVDALFDDKAYKCGINETRDGIELCWGKSEYGPKSYTLTWTFTDMVQNFPDEDGFIVRFINDQMDPAPREASFELVLPGTELTADNAAIWVFGNEGEIRFVDGKVRWESDRAFTPRHHLTVMMGFDKGLLHPTYKGSGTFEDLYYGAMEGSDYLDEMTADPATAQATDYEEESVAAILLFILPSMLAVGVGAAVLLNGTLGMKHKPKNAKEVNIKMPEYEREVPVGGYLPGLYYFHRMRDSKTTVDNFIAAYILKWLKDGCLSYEESTEETGLIFKRERDVKSFRLVMEPLASGSFEPRLWALIERSAGSDYVLQEKEMERYIKKHYEFTKNLFEELEPDGYGFATMNDLVVREKRGWSAKDYLTDAGKRELQYVFAFKRYLDDFTLLQERAPLEVELWDDYLIFATAYGLGEKVLEEFQKILPNYAFGQSSPDFRGRPISPYEMMLVHNFSRSVGRTAMRSYSEVRSANSRSGGSGGSGSFGGGGGFSGGGSGGGSR